MTGLSTHDVLHSTPEVANLILEMVREIAETAKAHDGIEFDEKTKEWQIARTYDLPSIVPSMLQDAQKGVEMEVEGLCGNIWRKAEALGVQTPRVKCECLEYFSTNLTLMVQIDLHYSPCNELPIQTQ